MNEANDPEEYIDVEEEEDIGEEERMVVTPAKDGVTSSRVGMGMDEKEEEDD